MNRYDIGMHSGNMCYRLPVVYHAHLSDQENLERVVNWFQAQDTDYSACIQPSRVMQVNPERLSIVLEYLYEGFDDFYPLVMRLQLACYEEKSAEHESVSTSSTSSMTSMIWIGAYEHAENGLFDEIIRDKVLPNWAKALGLRSVYTYEE